MKFYTLKIKSKTELNEHAVKITFDVPESLHEEFNYKAGQYITLDIMGERRDYSLCESPLNKSWSIGVKATPSGKISNYLVHKLKVGDELSVSTPNGRFTIPTKPNEKRTLLAFAAGSGITPILSLAEYTLQTEEWVNFYVFYANKTWYDVLFKDELDALKEKYPNNFIPYYFFTEESQNNFIFEGRLDGKKFQLIINQLVDLNETDEVMICGPEGMIFDLAKEVFEAGIPKKNIHFELFNPLINPEAIFPKAENEISEVEVTVNIDGETHQLVWNKSKNLIDAMLDEDIDAPYSCKGGVCSSCLCKVHEGDVILGDNFVLTDSDRADNLILACISRPKTPTLHIDFDAV